MSLSEDSNSLTTCLVLGGRNLAGRHLVFRLLSTEKWFVKVADLKPSLPLYDEIPKPPNIDPFDPSLPFARFKDDHNQMLTTACSSDRASYSQVDITNKSQLCEVISGSSVVFHMYTPDRSVNDFETLYAHIVQGTRNVIRACQECNVKKLIYNSSADVVFDGVHSIDNGDEFLQFPNKYEDPRNDLIGQAELMVLFANGNGDLLTCALRPSNLFGPQDAPLVPYFVKAAKDGWFKAIFGDGRNKWDFTYVENLAHAHICAEQALQSLKDPVSGGVFFITNLEPMVIWDFVSSVLEAMRYESPSFHIPVARFMVFIEAMERVYKNLCSYINLPPLPLSTSSLHLFTCTKTFNCSIAQKHIGYAPIVSMEEGIEWTVESYFHLARDISFLKNRDLNQPSKAYKLLGCGRVADVILWRDEKKTFSLLITLAFFFHWFLLSGRPFISSAAKLFQLVFVFLFLHACLPSSILGYSKPKIPASYFEVPETRLRDALIFTASAWNRSVAMLHYIAQGNDWKNFLKALCSLYLLKLLLYLPFAAVLLVGLVLVFSAFHVYEQKEEEVDRILKHMTTVMRRVMRSVMRKLPAHLTVYLSSNFSQAQDETAKDS
ncbi:hypothetical protein AMTRI_Chr06g178000 [Amborella trichopoda]